LSVKTFLPKVLLHCHILLVFYFLEHVMLTKADIFKQRDDILRIARSHGAYNVRLFGSVARGDATEASDIDLMVQFEEGRTLFDHGGLLMDLQDLLGRRVDVIDADGMRPRFRAVVMKEAVAL